MSLVPPGDEDMLSVFANLGAASHLSSPGGSERTGQADIRRLPQHCGPKYRGTKAAGA